METTASVVIDRPADVVFDVIADMSRNPEWQQGQRSCTWTSDPPLRVGSTYDQVASFLGRTITSSFEVVELEPGRRIRIRTTGGTMPIDVTRTVEPRGPDRCEVRAAVRGDPPRMFRLLGPLTRRVLDRSVRGDYERLRGLLSDTA